MLDQKLQPGARQAYSLGTRWNCKKQFTSAYGTFYQMSCQATRRDPRKMLFPANSYGNGKIIFLMSTRVHLTQISNCMDSTHHKQTTRLIACHFEIFLFCFFLFPQGPLSQLDIILDSGCTYSTQNFRTDQLHRFLLLHGSCNTLSLGSAAHNQTQYKLKEIIWFMHRVLPQNDYRQRSVPTYKCKYKFLHISSISQQYLDVRQPILVGELKWCTSICA